MRGIGGSGTILGEGLIKILFKSLGMIIDVTFSILKESSALVLSNRRMLVNGFNISLKANYLHVGRHHQQFRL